MHYGDLSDSMNMCQVVLTKKKWEERVKKGNDFDVKKTNEKKDAVAGVGLLFFWEDIVQHIQESRSGKERSIRESMPISCSRSLFSKKTSCWLQ